MIWKFTVSCYNGFGQPSCRNVTVCGPVRKNAHGALRQRTVVRKVTVVFHGTYVLRVRPSSFRGSARRTISSKRKKVERERRGRRLRADQNDIEAYRATKVEFDANEPWATFDVDLRYHFFLLPFFLPIESRSSMLTPSKQMYKLEAPWTQPGQSITTCWPRIECVHATNTVNTHPRNPETSTREKSVDRQVSA